MAYTERLRSSLMALISIFLRPMVAAGARLRRQGASDVVAILSCFNGDYNKLQHRDGVWLARRVLEEQEKLVLACAADEGQRAANTLMVWFQEARADAQRQSRRNGMVWRRLLPRLDHGLYVCDARNGGPRQLSRYLEALGVMCKRKRSWSGRRS